MLRIHFMNGATEKLSSQNYIQVSEYQSIRHNTIFIKTGESQWNDLIT